MVFDEARPPLGSFFWRMFFFGQPQVFLQNQAWHIFSGQITIVPKPELRGHTFQELPP